MKTIYFFVAVTFLPQLTFAMGCPEMQEPYQTLCKQNERILDAIEGLDSGGSSAYICKAWCAEDGYQGREIDATGSKVGAINKLDRKCDEIGRGYRKTYVVREIHCTPI